MLGSLKEGLEGIVKEKCHLCGEAIKEESIKAEVKIPTYTGTHEKSFCCKQHLKEWREEVKEWEKKNHKIPKSSKSCPTCMR